MQVFFEVSIFLAIHYKNKLYLDGFLAVKISKISIMIITGLWHNRYFPPAGFDNTFQSDNLFDVQAFKWGDLTFFQIVIFANSSAQYTDLSLLDLGVCLFWCSVYQYVETV